MTVFLRRRAGSVRATLLLATLHGLTGCEAPEGVTRPAPASPTAPALVVQGTPSPAVATPGPPAPRQAEANAGPVLFNDPPASPDTPLCGKQAREINAIGAVLQGSRVETSGICARFACYDPLTATYIGADGYRHVCR